VWLFVVYPLRRPTGKPNYLMYILGEGLLESLVICCISLRRPIGKPGYCTWCISSEKAYWKAWLPDVYPVKTLAGKPGYLIYIL
jgi:hypothetical protein